MTSLLNNTQLYSLTLQPSSYVNDAVAGNFAGGGSKQQQIVTVSGSRITLYQQNLDESKDFLQEVLTFNLYAIVRAVASFRVPGSGKGAFSEIFCAHCHVARQHSRPLMHW